MKTLGIFLLAFWTSFAYGQSWTDFIAQLGEKSPSHQLASTNRFFNQHLRYAEEKVDRWLLLDDFLAAGQGDCEDFAIGKYQTLLAKGFRAEEFSFIYAIQRGSGQAHIALLHNPSQSLLDSITNELSPLIERNDLKPILAFTAKNYQLLSSTKTLSNSERNLLSQWQHIIYRAENTQQYRLKRGIALATSGIKSKDL